MQTEFYVTIKGLITYPFQQFTEQDSESRTQINLKPHTSTKAKNEPGQVPLTCIHLRPSKQTNKLQADNKQSDFTVRVLMFLLTIPG